MAEGSQQQESQQQKMAAASAYDYDGDAKWIDYWSNVLIPDHLVSHPEVKKHFQLKYYKRYIDSELQVEPLSSFNKRLPSSTSSASAERRRPGNQAPQSSSQTQGGGTTSRAAPTRATPTTSGLLRLDRQSIQFLANAWVLIMTILTMFPFVPRGLGDRAYRFALVGTALACAHSLYSQYGIPHGWNLNGLQTWLQSVAMGSDFLQLLYCIVFASASVPIKYAVLPVACRSLEQVAPYLKRNFSSTELYRKFLAKPCLFVESNVTVLRGLSANSEVGLGFLLIVLMITPQRNMVQALVYWQLLKLKYHSPTSSRYHQEAWFKLGVRVNPLIQRFAPFLQTPLGYVQGWFLRAG
ncbi:unnamed protein product [Calypogeia fissa]